MTGRPSNLFSKILHRRDGLRSDLPTYLDPYTSRAEKSSTHGWIEIALERFTHYDPSSNVVNQANDLSDF
jgi:hypothetical protein